MSRQLTPTLNGVPFAPPDAAQAAHYSAAH
jgi:hypothetical protein